MDWLSPLIYPKVDQGLEFIQALFIQKFQSNSGFNFIEVTDALTWHPTALLIIPVALYQGQSDPLLRDNFQLCHTGQVFLRKEQKRVHDPRR
jgi:hypothetical protein